MFSYPELVALSQAELSPPLKKKLTKLLTTPFVSNEAYYAGEHPHAPVVDGIGRSLRLVFWNIERGLQLSDVKLAFSDKKAFLHIAKTQSQGSKSHRKIDFQELEEELDIIQSADVVVLNEVDWGVKRTDYQSVVKELGRALQMNWAYGVEFVEVDPMILGTEQFDEIKDANERAKMLEAISVDKNRLKALHGTAVLSRYPVRDAQLIPFDHKGYDWYTGEQNISSVEKGKRTAAILVGEKLGREIRRGGRTNLIVTLDVPPLKGGTLTVAATHLENRADPKDRRIQMEELFGRLKPVRNPIVIAGDLNTTLSRGRPRGIKDTVTAKMGDTSFWIGQGVKYGTGVGAVYGILVGSFKTIRFQDDPTASGVKFVADNPEAALFDRLEKFRFDDGTAIDFRGVKQKTATGNSGTLADSNERDTKGFVTTFQFQRTIGPKGKFKLDWIFVKSYLTDPRDEKGPYAFAPHFARTLVETNYAPSERMSDHAPISVDLPFAEPQAH